MLKPMTTKALTPICALQGLWVRRRTLKLPEARGHRRWQTDPNATDPVRWLVVGDSSAAGVGVDHQQQALIGQLHQHLLNDSHADHDLSLVGHTGYRTRQVHQALLDLSMDQPFDIAVVAAGVNDVTGMRRTASFRNDIGQLHATLTERFGVQHTVFSGLPPLHRFTALPQPLRWVLGQRAQTLDATLHQFCEGADQRTHLPFDFRDHFTLAADGFHPSAVIYSHWAKTVVQACRPVIDRLGPTQPAAGSQPA